MYDFLFALQQAREGALSFLTPLLFVISEFAYYGMIVIVFVLFLCIDKKKYTPLLFIYSISNFITNGIKLAVCENRPWIIDSRLHPHKLIEHSATGYSFPSGHTTGAASFYGTLAVRGQKNKSKLYIPIILWTLAVLTGFSRLWLGAHTPLDVAVGFIIGTASIFLFNYIFAIIDKHPDKDYLFTLGCIIISVVTLILFSAKSFAVEYNSDGSILVDPIKMQMDSWQSAGMVIGLSICWLIDRRYINFTTDISKKRKIVRCVIALVLFALLYMVLLKKLEGIINPLIGAFLRSFVTMIICTGVYPALFTKWEKKHPQQCC